MYIWPIHIYIYIFPVPSPHADPPPPPTNLVINKHHIFKLIYLSWSAPTNIATDTLQYKVSVTPSDYSILTTKTNHAIDISSFADLKYTVKVSTVTCSGTLFGQSSISGTFTLREWLISLWFMIH